MNRIFDLGNKAKTGLWVAAPDADTAKAIALSVGHAKKPENLRVFDITDTFLKNNEPGIADIIASAQTGVLVKEIKMIRGDEFFNALAKTGKPPVSDRGMWKFAAGGQA